MISLGLHLKIIIYTFIKVVIFPDYLYVIKHYKCSSSIYKCKDFYYCYYFNFYSLTTLTGPFKVEFNGDSIIFQAMQTYQGEHLLCLERLANAFASATGNYSNLSYPSVFGLHYL